MVTVKHWKIFYQYQNLNLIHDPVNNSSFFLFFSFLSFFYISILASFKKDEMISDKREN